MSRAIALVKFNDGTILRGCYDGASDFLCSWLITESELEQKYDGSVLAWNDAECENHAPKDIDVDALEDVEDVEIFSDYGSGIIWQGKASRKQMVVVEGLDPYYARWSEDIPDWVLAHYNSKGWDSTQLVSLRKEQLKKRIQIYKENLSRYRADEQLRQRNKKYITELEEKLKRVEDELKNLDCNS